MVEAEGETADLPGPSSGEEEQDPPAGRGPGPPGPEEGPPHTENHPDLLLLLHRPPHRTQTQHRDGVLQDHGDGPDWITNSCRSYSWSFPTFFPSTCPDLDQRFIMVEGEIMEDHEEDVETGSNTCWRWCPQIKKQ